MTAPTRLKAASSSQHNSQRWQDAVDIRREWLAHGLATGPADRIAAQHSLAGIYHRLSRRRPRFVWVDSPRQALRLVAGLPTLDTLYRWVLAPPAGAPPLASDLAAGLSRLRSALDAAADHPDLDATPTKRKDQAKLPLLPPQEALRAGVPLRAVLGRGIREGLRISLADGFYLPVRAALATAPAQQLPVAWYGQQESYWIAYFDVLRRSGLARFQPGDEEHLDDWATLARSCGWWWPGPDVCVIAERPVTVHTTPVPESWYEQVRATHVEYRDGWRPI